MDIRDEASDIKFIEHIMKQNILKLAILKEKMDSCLHTLMELT